VTEADLSDPDIVARFSALSRDQLVNYRNQVADPAVQAFIDNLLANLTPVAVPCSQQQASQTSKQAEQARQDALPFVKSARLALDRLHGAWINNKADILAGRRTLTGEVACAFNSNFNISPTDPDYGVRHIMVSRRLQLLEGRLQQVLLRLQRQLQFFRTNCGRAPSADDRSLAKPSMSTARVAK